MYLDLVIKFSLLLFLDLEYLLFFPDGIFLYVTYFNHKCTILIYFNVLMSFNNLLLPGTITNDYTILS
jgi:hypothetical protein